MKAIIMAGGAARRLKPITKEVPKALIKLDTSGNCIIDNQIKNLAAAGVTDIVVITGFEPEQIKTHLQKYSEKINLSYVHNFEYENTKPAYAFYLAKQYLTEPFVYLNGDVIFDPVILQQLMHNAHDSVTAIQKAPWNEEAVKVIVSDDGTINSIGKTITEQESAGEFIGVTKIGSNFLHAFQTALDTFGKQGDRDRFAVEALDEAIKANGGVLHAEFIGDLAAIEIDTPEDYYKAQEILEIIKARSTNKATSPFAWIKTVLSVSCAWIIRGFSLLIPRDQNLSVFIGWHTNGDKETFADNCKYLFLHMSKADAQQKVVWLTRDTRLITLLRSKGYAAEHMRSLSGIWMALRAGYTIVDAVLQRDNWKWSGRSKLIQLWHGRAIKDVDLHADKNFWNSIIFPNKYATFHKITASSVYGQTLMQNVFHQDLTDIAVTGFARNDIFATPVTDSHIDSHEDIVALMNETRAGNPSHKFILYAPTFRRGNKEVTIDKFFSSQELSDWLTAQNCTLLLSFHPKYKGQLRHKMHDNIIPIDDRDPYPVFAAIDMLVTDYSSSFVDFLLANKPMIFFAYDLEEYLTKEGITVDYPAHMPGPIVRDTTELLHAIENTFTQDTYVEKRNETRDLYHGFTDGKNCERIASLLQ